MLHAWLSGVVLCLTTATCISRAQAEPPYTFDGEWVVNLACPQSPDGAQAFSWQFSGSAKAGVFYGQHGTFGQPGWLRLNGQIQRDGSAAMIADGITGNSAYNVNNAAKGVPYQYAVTARFDGEHGTGTWKTSRICVFKFEKHSDQTPSP